jgi:hydroxymethylpyrimidine kinase/phosphomethylpyrimidine kinase/thiamine-phosphate diphosphorylase
MKIPFDLSLYLVTDRPLSGGRDMAWIVREAAAGGVTMVQLREKECSTAEFVALARELKATLTPLGIPLIINDRIDVALAVDADGVHIGQSDMPYETARALLGKEKIIGLSVETMDEVLAANELDVDYIGISPVYATPTKTDTLTPFGLEGIEQVMQQSRHRCVAIGGMNRNTIGEVIARGVEGVAVVSAIVAAESPREASAELADIIRNNHLENSEVSECPERIENNCQLSVVNCQFPRVLAIAGSDSGGGAGIQADIKSISANGCFAASAITAITAQNTLGVNAVEGLSIDIIEGQIEAVLSDIGADSVKIGMLHSSEVVHSVARMLRKYRITNVVLDPVMVSTSGHKLIEDSAIEVLKSELMPMARVITPNIPEAEILLGEALSKQGDLPDAARRLAEMYGVSVLLKAGHLVDDELIDIFYNRETHETVELSARRIDTRNTHGTGCTLSSAFAAQLAKGLSLTEAARTAKQYINQAIIHGANQNIGHGHGPVNHFYKL